MSICGKDNLQTRRTLNVGDKSYDYYSLKVASEKIGDVSKLPFTLKVVLENLLRYEDDFTVKTDDVKAVVEWLKSRSSSHEINYRPARVLMQDFTGVPAVVDLAAMRDAVVKMGGDAQKVNPLSPVDLVIDHSVMIDFFGTDDALDKNMEVEFERNGERYEFLRWGQNAFNNFRIVPPGAGICHQVNVEHLAKVVWTGQDDNGKTVAYPDTLVGTDSHTTMVNGLAVLGWGVGGLEAEAAMLGQPISMLIPEVVGFKLTGSMKEGITATDLVLRVVQMLREKGVVGKFVEFYGDALDHMSLPDRATIGNMAPEYGATCGFFPIDDETLNYMRNTGRSEEQIALVEAYAKEQGMWRDPSFEAEYTSTLELDISTVEPALSGPKRPQDRVLLKDAVSSFTKTFADMAPGVDADRSVPVSNENFAMKDGNVVIAAITSCTNTSNPSVLIAAGLLAKKAVELGLKSKPWVKTSLAPGSLVVADYLEKAGLQTYLDKLGFNVAGFGCTTCIGNSGPLADPIIEAIDGNDMLVTAVLSGNRNFEGRISPQVKANYLASPPLVVAYALAGNLKVDLNKDPIGTDKDGKDVFMKDIWPTNKEIADTIASSISASMYKDRYDNIFAGPKPWQEIEVTEGETFEWDGKSTYVQNPPYFVNMAKEPGAFSEVHGARPLLILADSVTTDHISPAGSIKEESPAGEYLKAHGVAVRDFNSYGARRGNHEVMMRGTFANIRIRNEMAPGTEGGVSVHYPSGEQGWVYDVAMRYQAEGTPLVVIAGKEYGTGSSRDWAAKGTNLLGVKAVLAESFERIHRTNLVCMGVLPLQFKNGEGRATYKLDGTEVFDVLGIGNGINPMQDVTVRITRKDGSTEEVIATCRIDTENEVLYYQNGGILQFVLRNMMKAA
ncbi:MULTISPECIES: aconitate hydratase AcnA [Thalassospira]|uniref:Aconitate hydratase n=2 Tax=Thalassospira TaxID=168934 RepID=A0ABR5Y4N4_9PROT|nr:MULTISPECIES: aconitate hydratase AcnA [Thalassospira]MBR9779588.1 aconitate hydratase AcnA [Rhodospirillales bacterium]KEO59603.1 aconitate hydratase [Thalassospira permensis NBRC 106175]KZD05370.1 aconitate hydratase [Thalassospira xiamenensis]KZD07884.1 aconitate hydratase [Thalassospira xiamenensis]MBR9816968.1 aconitate hydratase AcnA [Rhodospirillales bacterium]|eukprot:TRINITY_DN1675_c0_g1_i2.p1 TRINITY_DN1675_c0_g1~~TRINITY_DN1675_c0_g1_i2.p1  ORF type:complete len:896 (-),score=331.21 TRINITY_DN1675_c0_g1_i2:382-3069(-)